MIKLNKINDFVCRVFLLLCTYAFYDDVKCFCFNKIDYFLRKCIFLNEIDKTNIFNNGALLLQTSTNTFVPKILF